MKHSKQAVREGRASRFVMMLTDSEHQAIQNHRFAKRIGTMAEAARQLIAKGLEAEEVATTGVEIGVLSPVVAGNTSHQETTDVGSDT